MGQSVMKACLLLLFIAFLQFQNNADAKPAGSSAAAVDSLGSAVDGAAHALVKRSPLVHAKAKKKSRVSHGPPHMKRKCPRGHRYNKKTRKCQKQKKGPNTETGIRGLNK